MQNENPEWKVKTKRRVLKYTETLRNANRIIGKITKRTAKNPSIACFRSHEYDAGTHCFRSYFRSNGDDVRAAHVHAVPQFGDPYPAPADSTQISNAVDIE